MTDEGTQIRKRKPNSPKAPGVSLRTAFNEVSKVYQQYSHGAFLRSELASALGMSSGSGAFLGKASTLKEYGLLTETGREVRVSDLFKAMYATQPGSPELKRLAWQAVRSPNVFARLVQQFRDRIPDEGALAMRLESQERFNRERAMAVATAFRSSLNEFGLIDQSGNVLSVREQPAVDGTTEAAEEGAADDDRDAGDQTGAPGRQRLEVALRDSRKAVLILPDDLSSADTRKIAAVLTALAAEYEAD